MPRLAGSTGASRDRALAAALLSWFEKAARDLPWRRTRDPYAVWVSEVMLQQTRVETVVPYFERFLARFPTPARLAAAELDDVLAAWSGLGYYRRARSLHLAAREVVERFGGELPANIDALRSLHGVGPYTAGAIASLAFELPEALVDGNVARVLSRLEGIDTPIDSGQGKRELWATARRMLPGASAGRFNEALMELGAMVCTPRAPVCSSCPVAKACVAHKEGREGELPVTTPKRAVPAVPMVAGVFVLGARVLLGRRPREGLFGGMWEAPMVEARNLRSARSKLTEMGVVGASALHANGRIAHVLSHLRLDVLVASAPGAGRAPKANHAYEAFAWLDPTAAEVGVSSLARKVLARAGVLASKA